ncbi:MAG: glycosyltransferase family 4 protein [Solirubrobacteraceae bacterium]
MAAVTQSLRVQGVALPDVSDWAAPLPAGKWSQFFKALAERTTLVGVTRPAVSRLEQAVTLARAFHPDRAQWRGRYGFSLDRVARLDRRLQAELAARRDRFDLIVQLQTLCSPRSVGAPYVIYTDNTFALTRRIYPVYGAMPALDSERWQRFEADVCGGAQCVFTFSEFARASVIEDYGCAPDRVLAVGAGANQVADSLDGKDYTARRALFVGSPFTHKGGEVLLRAWPLVRERVPDAELCIVGPRRDPAPGFGHGVTWAGRIDREALAELYRGATVFVLPSLFDAWGHVFVEAMGYGLPCIGSDCCAMPELIEDGTSGRLVAREAVKPLADALCETLTDPELAARMGRAGYQRVQRELRWEHVIDRVMGRLAEVSVS